MWKWIGMVGLLALAFGLGWGLAYARATRRLAGALASGTLRVGK